jgi:hypothetical protein
MKLFEKIKLEVEYPTGTWTAVVPTNEDLTFIRKKEKGYQLYSFDIDTALQFTGASYAFLKSIEENDRCAYLPLRVSEGGTVAFTGKLRLVDGDYNVSQCTASSKTASDSSFTCLTDGLKVERNILGVGGNVVLKPFIGTVVTQRCPSASNAMISGLLPVNPPVQDSCLAQPDGWVVLENNFDFIAPNGSPPPWTAEHHTIWTRIEVTSATEPPGGGWTNIGGGTWVKSPVMEYDYENSIGPPTVGGGSWHQIYKYSWVNQGDIDNGRTLENILAYFIQNLGCPLTIASNFFNINPDGTAPVNDAYTAAAANMANVVVFQKSDVKRANVSNNATIGRLTLEEIFAWLEALNVFPTIEANTLRIEHITYYLNKPTGLNIDLPTYSRWAGRSNRYTYRTDEMPRFEKWAYMERTDDTAFEGSPIDYFAACSNGETVQHSFTRAVANISKVVSQPDSFSDDGFVLVAAVEFQGDLYVSEENGLINGHLSVPAIQDNYFMDYAYQESGVVNFNTVTFNSVRPQKRAEPVSIPNFCLLDFVAVDPNALITRHGEEMEAETLRYSARGSFVTFELIY